MGLERSLIIINVMVLFSLALFLFIGSNIPDDFEFPQWADHLGTGILGLLVSFIVIGRLLSTYSKRRFRAFTKRVEAVKPLDFDHRYFSISQNGMDFMNPLAQKKEVKLKEKILGALEEYIADNDDVSTAITDLKRLNARNDLSKKLTDPRFKRGHGIKDQTHPDGIRVQYAMRRSVLGEQVYEDMRNALLYTPFSYVGDTKIPRRKRKSLQKNDTAQIVAVCNVIRESEQYDFADLMSILASGTTLERKLLSGSLILRYGKGNKTPDVDTMMSFEKYTRAEYFRRTADMMLTWKREGLSPGIELVLMTVENEMEDYAAEFKDEILS